MNGVPHEAFVMVFAKWVKCNVIAYGEPQSRYNPEDTLFCSRGEDYYAISHYKPPFCTVDSKDLRNVYDCSEIKTTKQQINRQCFRCDKLLKSCGSEPDDINNPPCDATAWQSVGNYGSTVFDGIYSDVLLELYICDNCLKAKAAFVYQYRVEKSISDVRVFKPE